MAALWRMTVALMAAAGAFLPVPCHAQPADMPLVGRYVVVGIRAASDVAGPVPGSEQESLRALIGTELRAGDRVSWYRERCDVRPGRAERSAALVERNLADLQIAPGARDARLNRNLIVDCLGRAIGDIWEVLVVDRRVLVARSSPSRAWLILEQPLAPGDVRLLKQRLRQLGFDPGSQDERMDEATRAAIAAFAVKNGAPAAFMPGILTVNLMNAIAEAPPR
jgi:hypothetical protein